ncbi:bifunctional tRNA (5-methylaminomethyl-2-thiouridine)(34)-methyltransferase MnmD/FAD-dependent 5-carboxymethylaminomethyl-2-thiouridine(34) oxidoreductase MnmC [Temperatibacter marinus]|uniref:tRNA 5-methylaminomethyl-2-thiouridine biosynthesis bifunctional protein MnmC n=1 Tax=Temperatibacter marinus TaxID=1456591 RepID=A0AA52EFF3_9PROT|nr:bifunctional tRNA (5-methylaminomethyl-2-thiouridine)(34)-methyltransferase MnmD/FAD-dependent 5-carboxymethylaminomethyl-2-thiouridine(34) oxidoreductase MnmC [Temperatibacter marinus]WND02118.1 bifunctional tRNA (5-methylaminomethyl-2-thiouridine)(34)-methyltransferase MnmD/FAD-dependent 5-carboxymethylaminomethyl-2-thiouridine(34) oxidoreductase MnmC [Temperatibacter marinus]
MTSKKTNKITISDLEWKDGTPVSPVFDDVYFSKGSGIAETNHVFINGIDLPEALAAQSSRSACYVIGETGFGTGLNFLQTWKTYRELDPKGRLMFISFEKYPLDKEALEEAHSHLPDLASYSNQLRDQYPVAKSGYHVCSFDDGKVTLLLIYGDITLMLPTVQAKVDAWYLDGFAPAKNPDMWSDEVFAQLGRLSKVGAKLATFTAAGFVRRGLQSVGFDMRKAPGYGRKRERLLGTFSPERGDATAAHHSWPTPMKAQERSVAIIGAGFAGAFTAYALRQRGIAVTVFQGETTHTASQVPAAILAPRFMLEETALSDFLLSSYLTSSQHPALRMARIGNSSIQQYPIKENELERFKRLVAHLDLPPTLIQIKGGKLLLPSSSCYNTQKLLNFLLDDIDVIPATITDYKFKEDTNRWSLQSSSGDVPNDFSDLLLATGYETSRFHKLSPMRLRPNRGQLVTLEDTDKIIPKGTHSFGGYLSDRDPEFPNKRIAGSSFNRAPNLDTWQAVNTEDSLGIIQKLNQALDINIGESLITDTFVGMRCTTIDQLPSVGKVPNFKQWEQALRPLSQDKTFPPSETLEYQKGLYILSGLGSKGLQYAPLCAAYLAALITSEPCPVPKEITSLLCPGRFLKRDIIRRDSQ